MSSATLYLLLILAIVAERFGELLLTRRNSARLLARGGKVAGQAHYPAMVALHSSLLIGAPLEVFLLGRPFLAWLGWPMLALVGATMALPGNTLSKSAAPTLTPAPTSCILAGCPRSSWAISCASTPLNCSSLASRKSPVVTRNWPPPALPAGR